MLSNFGDNLLPVFSTRQKSESETFFGFYYRSLTASCLKGGYRPDQSTVVEYSLSSFRDVRLQGVFNTCFTEAVFLIITIVSILLRTIINQFVLLFLTIIKIIRVTTTG